MSSIFGTLFRVSTFGESHGAAIGCIVDGCPPQLPLTAEEIQVELDRRRPGQSKIVTQRKEADRCEILSGVLNGKTLGTSIAIVVRNEDQRSDAYKEMETAYRPSHADYTYDAKYGIRAVAGGGRSSARETIARVAAGVIAQKILRSSMPSYECLAYVRSVKDIEASAASIRSIAERDRQSKALPEGRGGSRVNPQSAIIEGNLVRTCDPVAAKKMVALIEKMRKEGNSVGGVIECMVRGVQPGSGEPVFDKLEADLAKAMLSLPATKGFEIGSGFDGTLLTGLEHNDEFTTDKSGKIRTKTNRSGGIQGGISNGEAIIFRIAFKPTATLLREQKTVTKDGQPATLKARGRHDPCVLPRAVPIVEAMTHLVLADHFLRQRAQNG